MDAVEIDGELTTIGRRYFGLGGPRLHVHTADARPYLISSNDRFDVISVDAYRQPYIPFYLATREFFDLVREHLAPGGVAILNVGHPAGEQALVKVLAATMRAAFPYVMADPAEPTNTQLVASMQPISGAILRRRAASVPAALRPTALVTAATLEPAPTGGSVYTDDRAPVEWLVDGSILDYATRSGAGR